MLEKYYPSEYAGSAYDIDYRRLYESGIRGIIFDVDNTLVHHGDDATPEAVQLFRDVQAIGFKTVLLTNNDEERVTRFNADIGTQYVCDAEKPAPEGYEKALTLLGVQKNEALVIGDQMFVDIIGANRCGIRSILVHYIEVPGEKWLGFKRYIEKIILVFFRISRRNTSGLSDNRERKT